MTPAELNILVNVRAREALAQIDKISLSVTKLDQALASASVGFSKFVGSASGGSNGVKMFSASIADLSKNLALINKSQAHVKIDKIGASSALATASVTELAAALKILNKELQTTVVAGNSAAASVERLAGANAAMMGAGAAAAGAAAGMGKASKASNDASNAATNAANKTSTAGKEMVRFSGNWENYAGKTRQYSTELARAGNVAASSAGQYRMVGDALDANGRKIPVASTNLNNLGTAVADADTKTNHWSQTLGAHSDRMQGFGSKLQWAGRQISLYFTAPVALAAAAGTKWLMDLQRQQTDLAKVYGENPFGDYSRDLEILNKGFRDQSERLGIAQTEITRIGAAWAQAGVEGKNLAEATKLTAEAMIVGDQSADEALEGLVAVRQQWRLGSKDALTMQQAIADMNMASNITQVSFKDLPDAMSRVGATAHDVGLTFQQTTAMITSLAGVTGTAATAGNGLKSILASLVNPTKKFRNEVMEASNGMIDLWSRGFQTQAPEKKLQQLAGVIEKMPEDLQVKLASDFGGKWQLSRSLQLLKDINNEAGNYQKVMKATSDLSEGSTSMAAYNKELQTYLDSNPQKFKIAGEKIRNSLMDVAVVLLPHIVAIAEAIAKMAKAFAASPDWVQKAAIAFAVFMAVIGPLAMTLGVFNVLFGTLGKTVAWFGKTFTQSGREAAAAAKGVEATQGPLSRAAAKTKAAAKTIWTSVKTRIGGAWKAAAAETAAGSKATATAAGKGANEAAAAAATGNARMKADYSTTYATMTAEQRAAYIRMMSDQKRFQAERTAANRAAGIVIEGQIIAQGRAEEAAYRANAARNAAAAASGAAGAGAASAAGAGGAAAAAAAARSGEKTGAAAAEGTKRGFKAKLGGGLGTILTAALFIPPSWFAKIGNIFKDGFSKLGGVFSSIFERMGITSVKTFGQTFVKFIGGKGGWIGAIITAIVGAFTYAWDDIKKMAGKIMDDGGVPIIAKPFIIGVKAINMAIMKLPQMVRDVFTGTVNLIKKAAMAIYNLFSYINPFAHHSPSLVENVQNGMAVVTSQFADADKSIQKSVLSSYGAISKFGKATAGLKLKADNINLENTNKNLNKADPSGKAAGAYNALNNQAKRLQGTLVQLNAAMLKQQRVIDGYEKAIKAADEKIEGMNQSLARMQQVADATGKALDYAQSQLDKYSSAPLKGMRAMSDAIFENEMAQKRLQLQISKLEQAGQSIDDVKDKYAALQGQIEMLSGERNDLQAKGAGSDILKVYDDQIGALKDQQKAISSGTNSAVNEITRLNAELDKLGKKGEQLDLENSLKFDPLTRQIEQAADASKEMTFGEALAGTQRYRAEVDILTAANNSATAAVQGQQQAIDAATASRDTLQKKMDVEQQKLDGIKSTYDATSTAIDDTKSAMDEITSAADTVIQRMDEIAQAQKEAADAADKNKDSIDKLKDSMDGLGDIDTDGISDALGDAGAEGAEEFDNKLDDGIGNALNGVGDKIKDFFKGIPGKIGDFFKNIGPKVLDALKKLPGELAKGLSYLAGWLLGTIAKNVFTSLAAVLYFFPKWIYENIYKKIPGIIAKIASFLTSKSTWSGLWNGIKSLFSSEGRAKLYAAAGEIIAGLFSGITDKLKGVFFWVKAHIVDPFIKGFKDALGIHSPSTVMADLGKNVIEGLYNGITGAFSSVVNFFTSVGSRIVTAIGDLGSWIGGKFIAAWNWITTNLPIWAQAALDWFLGIGQWIADKIGDLGSWIGGKFSGAWNWIITNLPIWAQAVFDWFGNVGQWVFDKIGDLGKWIGDKFSGAWNWVRDQLPSWAQGAMDWIANLGQRIADSIGDLGKWIGDKFKGAWDWVSSKIGEWADPVVSWFKKLPELIGNAVDGIRDKVKAPINVVIDTVYNNGIRRVWNATASKLPGIGEMAEIQHLATGGTVGNRITGPGTGTSDSILTSAKPGAEIFTAREVGAAGGFRGLEKILSSMGVSGFSNSGSNGGVPVALSNGEFKLDPNQIKQAGGMSAIKKLRAQLDSGQIPGHDIGGAIKSVVTAPGKALTKTARSGIAKAFEIALNQIEGMIPDGIGFESWGKVFFNTMKDKLVDRIAGKTDAHRNGGTVGIPRMATGGTVPTSGGGVPTAAATPAAASPGGATGVVDPATGAGLENLVAQSTDAALNIWKTYYTNTELAQTANTNSMQAAQLAADTAMLAEQTAASATMLTNQTTANATFVANQTASNAALTATNTAFRASETSAQSTFNAALIAADTTTKTTLNNQLTAFTTAQTGAWNQLRTDITTTATEMSNDVSARFTEMGTNIQGVVENTITPTISSFEQLLTKTVGWFTQASADIGTQWSQTVPKVQDPTRTIINDVYNNGVRVAWSKVHTWLDLPELDQFVAPFAEGGSLVPVSELSNPNSPKNVKNGGPLRASSASRDSTLFAGMRGEYVLNKKMVQGAGGVGNLEAWRSAVNRGIKPVSTGGTVNFDAIPGFAAGGALDMKKRPENQAVPGVIQQVPQQLKPWYGKPYDYGGGGTPGYDCSGWTGAVHKILLGQSPIGRIWSTEVNFGSFGYKRGKDGYWSIGVHNGGGGMNSHTAGTLAGVNYEAGGAHNTSIWGGPAAGTINPQFENQYYLPALGGKFVGTAGGDGTSSAITPMIMQMWDDHMKGVKDKVSALKLGGSIGKDPMAAFDKFNGLRKVVEKKAQEKDAAAAAAAAAAYGQAGEGSYGGGVERWRSVVLDVLRETGNPLSWDEPLLQQMQLESGGNPRAINLWDSNAAKGTPSKGLLQVIDPTFQKWRDPRYPNDPYDPKANIAASINYQKATYGAPRYHGQGYDAGGWLQPGVTNTVNLTGKPEAILTNTDWKAVYKAAMNGDVDAKVVSDGFVNAMKEIYGINTDKSIQNVQQAATEVALEGQNAQWTPQIIEASDATTAAVDSTTAAVNTNTDATYSTLDTISSVLAKNEKMTDLQTKMVSLLTAISTSSSSITVDKDGKISATFGAFAPAINALADVIESLPGADPTYVSWAGTGITVTDEMKRQKQQNDLANSAKGLYFSFKKIAPPLLRSAATIGSAIETLIQQDSEGWAFAAAAMAQNNPAGYLAAGILILKEILVLLPLIINAIMDIGPAIIESLIAYFTKFEPDSVYAYGDYGSANAAVNDNLTAIQNGATAPSFETVQMGNTTTTYNILGDITVKADSKTTAEGLLDNLLHLAGI